MVGIPSIKLVVNGGWCTWHCYTNMMLFPLLVSSKIMAPNERFLGVRDRHQQPSTWLFHYSYPTRSPMISLQHWWIKCRKPYLYLSIICNCQWVDKKGKILTGNHRFTHDFYGIFRSFCPKKTHTSAIFTAIFTWVFQAEMIVTLRGFEPIPHIVSLVLTGGGFMFGNGGWHRIDMSFHYD